MTSPHDPNRTVDVPSVPAVNEPHDLGRTVDVPTRPSDSLDVGLAAGFGKPSPPRSSLGAMRPVLLKEVEGDSAHIVKPKSDAMPLPGQAGDRYRLDGEIARGGMGAVLRGRDVDLGRDLAVKVLLEQYADRPEVIRRFIEEAQIGGQLQHPGVVPVYDIGHFGDRPFFTMKLVKGHTLAAMLGDRDEPGADRPRFLAIALQVSQAVAYAHAKGVIHRDLKPANIMVGAFGEVQVMDWGLAKVLAEGGVADEERASRAHQADEGTQIRTARSSGSAGSFGTETEAGSLLGTPAYMPPEQANGDIAHLDRRCDVFGLGALLCEILTGKPPYVGRSHEEVRRKAANGDLADAAARLDACGADPELVAVAKACLAAEAIDRPRDAQEVAEGLSAYLEGVQERLQAAQRERAVALAREAEQRKRRKVQLALAAALVALLVGGGTFAFWRNAQAQAGRERDARNAEAVAALLNQSEEALHAGDAAKARVALEAAKDRAVEGGAEEEAEGLRRLDADLKLLEDLDSIDQFRWTAVDNHIPDHAVVAKRTREALERFGADPDAASVKEAAARVSASVVRERIVTALDRLLWAGNAAGVRDVLRRVDDDPYRDKVRDAVLARDQAELAKLAEQKAALDQPPGFAAFLGESNQIRVGRRRQLLEAAVSRQPGNLSLLVALGTSYPPNQQAGANERLRWFQAAVAAAPGNSAVVNALGNALQGKGQVEDALAWYQKAIDLAPTHATAHGNLGAALADKGRVDEAIACLEKAIALDPKAAMPHYNLGIVLERKGRLDDAIQSYQKSVALAPKDSRAHTYLGLALASKGQLDDAIDCHRRAIALAPKGAEAHSNLGKALHAKGKADEAIACFEKAVVLDPKDAKAHYNLGLALKGKGRLDDAIASYQKSASLDPKDAETHFGLGYALARKGKVDDAIASYQKSAALDPKDALTASNLGNELVGKRRVDEGIAWLEKAAALDPKDAVAPTNLGNALLGKGRVDEAIAWLEKAVALDPKYAVARYNLGNALRGKERVNEAIACYEKTIEIDPTFAEAHCNLGHALGNKGRFAESLAALERGHKLGSKRSDWRYSSAAWVRQAKQGAVLETKLPAFRRGEYRPVDLRERMMLAVVCQVKKLHHTAAGLYAATFAAEPRLAADPKTALRYHAACQAALAASGRGEDAGNLGSQQRMAMRRQALTWLSADLAAWSRLYARGGADRSRLTQTLTPWQKNPDLSGLRDEAALAKLSAEERAACERLWADVAALLKKSEGKTQ